MKKGGSSVFSIFFFPPPDDLSGPSAAIESPPGFLLHWKLWLPNEKQQKDSNVGRTFLICWTQDILMQVLLTCPNSFPRSMSYAFWGFRRTWPCSRPDGQSHALDMMLRKLISRVDELQLRSFHCVLCLLGSVLGINELVRIAFWYTLVEWLMNW